MGKRITHYDRVLSYLEKHGSITTKDAYDDLGCTRLSEYIRQLRADGYIIETVNETNTNRYGEKTTYGRYVLKGGDDLSQSVECLQKLS